MRWKDFLYKGRLIAGTVLHRRGILPGKIQPDSVALKLTENCNARCVTCDFWRTSHKPFISSERAKQLLSEIHELGVRRIVLTGGEPLLRKDLFDLLDHCEESWFDSVVLATNGLLIDRFGIDPIVASTRKLNRLDFFVLSDGYGRFTEGTSA